MYYVFYLLHYDIDDPIWKSKSLTFPRIPALLKISSEKNTVSHLKKDVKQLNQKLSQLQALLEEKESQLHRLGR